jgi:aminopeptidase N
LLLLASLALWLPQSPAAPVDDRFAQLDPAVVARARAIAAQAPTEQLPPPRTVDVVHYALHLDLDPAAGRLAGRAELELRPAAAARRSIALDADGLVVQSVQLAGAALPFRQSGACLEIDLGREVAPEETLRVELAWTAAPIRGLFFMRDAAGQCTQVWSQNQCRMASAWFPCRDYPDDRASSELFVTLPDGWRTISNGVLIESSAAGEGRRRDHWRMDFPHPAFLTSLCAGPFVELDLGRVRDLPLFGYALAGHQEDVAVALQPTGAMLERLERFAGLAFPYPVYRQVAVEGFPWGGMENIAASTLDRDDLRRADAPPDTWADSDALVVHELAHQWFGNLLTPAAFADLWLAEGFATLAELDWRRHASGEAAELAGWFALQDRLAAARRDDPRPIVSARCIELDDLFTPHAYEGGAATLRLLQATLGDEPFDRIVKGLVQRGQNRSLTTAEVEAMTSELAGRDLSAFFVEWLHSSGQPELECEWQYDTGTRRLRLVAHQKQQGEGVPEVFHAPITVAWTTGAGRRLATLQLDARRNEVALDCDERPRYVHWNVGSTLPGFVTSKQAPAEWRAALAQESDPGGRIVAARALAAAWPGLPEEARDRADDERTAIRRSAFSRMRCPRCAPRRRRRSATCATRSAARRSPTRCGTCPRRCGRRRRRRSAGSSVTRSRPVSWCAGCSRSRSMP